MGSRMQLIHSNGQIYHEDDIPFAANLSNFPDTFTHFKEKVEKVCTIRASIRAPKKDSLPCHLTAENLSAEGVLSDVCGFDFMPSLHSLGFDAADIALATAPDPRGVMAFRGGEDAALSRLQTWMFTDDRLKDYFDVRNGMLGEAYSSKLSPWLACGK